MKAKTFTKILTPALALSMLLSNSAFAEAVSEAESSEASAETVSAQTASKVRTIITTDGEVDDQCSLVRYLLYANEFELEGIVSTSSMFHYTDQGEGMFKGKDSNQEILDAYAEVYDNLSTHAEGYPTPEFLTEHNFEGNVTQPGEMGTDTEGSLFIKDCIMDEREDRLLIQAWGGCNTIAAALRSIEDEYKDTEQWEEIYNKICNKVVIVNDLDQDAIISDYFLTNWPNLPVLLTYTQYTAMGYPEGRETKIGSDMEYYYSAEWMQEKLADKGALADVYLANLEEYADRSQGAFLSEGDTPCFTYALDVGLRSFEDPSYGGWGGRYEKVMYNGGGYSTEGSQWSSQNALWGLWIATDDDGDYFKPLYRWIEDFQNDFAARLEWCVAPYEETNHAPTVTVEEGIDLTAKKGDTITLTASASDPDGDDVSISFWQYGAADTYGDRIELTEGENNQISFVVPDDAKAGNTIHIIVEAEDSDEDTPITRYQRVIVTVEDDAATEETAQ